VKKHSSGHISAGKSPLPGKQPRILVAPLDWGLGHATRCIPVIRELIFNGCEVWLAGEGSQEKLLRMEFPELPFLQLNGYRIRYGSSGKSLTWKLIKQIPKIRRAIKQEHNWLKKTVQENQFDAVISDNRYGLYHETIPCYFITHQLTIKSPFGKWSERVLQKWNYKYINRFAGCWVPDTPGEENLAGELSHPANKPAVPLKYIGWLSRFTTKKIKEETNHLLFILSGPEPQRTALENIFIRDIGHYHGSATIVRGLPGNASLLPSTNTIKIYNHLSADELNDEMIKATFVISRSGYSTAMDIAVLRKKSILIPTPGQTEQEYLAGYYIDKQIACSALQQYFSLPVELQKAKFFHYQFPAVEENNLLRDVITEMLAKF
jgi:hypothetical protein